MFRPLQLGHSGNSNNYETLKLNKKLNALLL